MSFSEIDRPKSVWDENGIKYELIKELSSGSQGVTYLTHKQNTLIKLAFSKNKEFIINDADREQYYQRLRYMRSLPIPKNTKLTPPESLLKKYAGYKMTFLEDMESFYDNFIAPLQLESGNFKFPSFFIKKYNINIERLDERNLKKLKKLCNDIKKYLNSGGLKRRLIALGNASVILSQLHYNGLVYGDISFNNTFISKNVNEQNVWFIDLDNLVEDMESEWSTHIGTPGTMAPEIYSGESACTMRSDDYGFAMLAFKLITNIHPFHGKTYNSLPFDNEPSKDDLAEFGEFAWIFDPEDNSNENKCFVEKDYLISKELMQLFWEMFTNGKLDVTLRPPIHLWAREFFKEADNLSFCNDQECGMSFINKNGKCPLCGKKIKDELVINIKSLKTDQVFWTNRYTLKSKGKTSDLHLYKRAIAPFNVSDYDTKVLNMEISDKGLVISKDKFCDICLQYLNKDGRTVELSPGKTSISLDELNDFKIIAQLEIPRIISFEINN